MNSPADETPDELNGDLVVVQRNPMSGSGRRRREVDSLVLRLEREGLKCEVFTDRTELDECVRTQSSGRLRCIVAAGGDGTLASVVNRHPRVPALMLPQGTENLAARYFHLSRDGEQIAEVVIHGRVQSFDTGLITRANETAGGDAAAATDSADAQLAQGHGDRRDSASTRFLLMASAGVDAEIATRLAEHRKGTISHFTYLKPLIGSFWSYGFDTIHIHSDDADVDLEGTHVIAANLPPYGLGLPFSPDADGTDGLFDVTVLTGGGRLRSLTYAIGMLCRHRFGPPTVSRFRCRHLTLTPRKNPQTRIPVQADGDPAHRLPCQIDVDPHSMLLIVPKHWRAL